MFRLPLLCMLFLFSSLYAEEAHETRYKIIFTDNTAATGGPNDMGQTGDLEIIYTDPEKNYKISMKGEVFVNAAPQDTNITRENPNNLRIDLFSVYLIQGDDFKYGFGIEILGNLGGGPVQNFIHDVTSNPNIPARYVGRTHATPTFNAEYKTQTLMFEQTFDFLYRAKIPFLFQYGVATFDTMMTYRQHDLYDLGIDTGIALGVDCTLYPNLPAFGGSPLGDYQICTPETKLSLQYKNFDFFWEIPLMNMHVQNSVLGISYRF